MYYCTANFVCEDGKFIKGGVYKALPLNSKYHSLFIADEKKSVEINEEKIETASLKRKGRRKKKK